MPLFEAALNPMAEKFKTDFPFIAIHTAVPSEAGSNQAASARLAANWTVADDGDIAIGGAKNFVGGAANGPATHLGFWSQLAVGGVCGGYGALTGDQAFNSAGEYTVDSFTVNGS